VTRRQKKTQEEGLVVQEADDTFMMMDLAKWSCDSTKKLESITDNPHFVPAPPVALNLLDRRVPE